MKRFVSGWGLGMVMGFGLSLAIPAIAAVCTERVSGGIGGSGFLGGKQTVMEMAVGETGIIACQQQQKLVQVMEAGDMVKSFTCQKR